MWKPRGVRFVFDQHDLNPELYLSRFGRPTGLGGRLQLGGLRWLERMTYRTSDHVIATNESPASSGTRWSTWGSWDPRTASTRSSR